MRQCGHQGKVSAAIQVFNWLTEGRHNVPAGVLGAVSSREGEKTGRDEGLGLRGEGEGASEEGNAQGQWKEGRVGGGKARRVGAGDVLRWPMREEEITFDAGSPRVQADMFSYRNILDVLAGGSSSGSRADSGGTSSSSSSGGEHTDIAVAILKVSGWPLSAASHATRCTPTALS